MNMISMHFFHEWNNKRPNYQISMGVYFSLRVLRVVQVGASLPQAVCARLMYLSTLHAPQLLLIFLPHHP